jgi:hypothetical protein
MKIVYSIPLIGYLVLFCFGAYAAFVVGHWPFYGNPDPKDLPTGGFREVVLLTSTIAAAATPVLVTTFLARLWEGAWPLRTKRFEGCALALAAAFWGFELFHLQSAGCLANWLLE